MLTTKSKPLSNSGDGKPLPDEEVEFILIGAGLPRTGTKSTYTALEMILPGKCHHMVRVGTDKTSRNFSFWAKAVAGEAGEAEWRKFVRDERLSAGVSFPFAFFWKDLIKMYPEAKVLLNDRDPVRWYESVENTVVPLVGWINSPVVRYNPIMLLLGALQVFWTGSRQRGASATCYSPTPLGSEFPEGMFGAVQSGKEQAVRFFHAWKAQVMSEVPADRLLVWQVKEGWAPLCQFLGVPIPDQPFPNVNDTQSMLEKISKLKSLAAGTWALTFGVVGLVGYFFL